jgi:hypothetical protein
MNTKDLLSLGVPLGAAQRRATDFSSTFIHGGGDKPRPARGCISRLSPGGRNAGVDRAVKHVTLYP